MHTSPTPLRTPGDDDLRDRLDADDDPPPRSDNVDRRREALEWSRDVVVEAWLEGKF